MILNKKEGLVSYLLVSVFCVLCSSLSPVISHNNNNNNYALLAGGVVAGSVASGGLIYFLRIKKLNKKFFELIEENKVLQDSRTSLNQSIKKQELEQNLKNLQAEKQKVLKKNADLEEENKEQRVDIQAKNGLILQYWLNTIWSQKTLNNLYKKVNNRNSEKIALQGKITGMEQKIKEGNMQLEIVQKNLHSLENQLLLLNQQKNKDALKSFVFVRCIKEQNNIMSILQKKLTQKEDDVHSLKVLLEEQQNYINKMKLDFEKMKEEYEDELKARTENLQEVMKQCAQYENYFIENANYINNLISPFNENRDLRIKRISLLQEMLKNPNECLINEMNELAKENAELKGKIAELQNKINVYQCAENYISLFKNQPTEEISQKNNPFAFMLYIKIVRSFLSFCRKVGALEENCDDESLLKDFKSQDQLPYFMDIFYDNLLCDVCIKKSTTLHTDTIIYNKDAFVDKTVYFLETTGQKLIDHIPKIFKFFQDKKIIRPEYELKKENLNNKKIVTFSLEVKSGNANTGLLNENIAKCLEQLNKI